MQTIHRADRAWMPDASGREFVEPGSVHVRVLVYETEQVQGLRSEASEPLTSEGGAPLTTEGHYWDLSDLAGRDWVVDVEVSEVLEQPVGSGTIRLHREDGHLSLVPTTQSKLNRLSNGQPGALLQVGRRVDIFVQLGPKYAAPDPDRWRPLWAGRIDDIDWSSDDATITLACRGLGGRLTDTFIEEERTYNEAADATLEATLQAILDDNLGAEAPQLYAPTPSGWVLGPFTQDKTTVMDAMVVLAAQRGATLGYRFVEGEWRLTLVIPDRSTPPTVLAEWPPTRVFAVNDIRSTIVPVRNVVRVVYDDAVFKTREIREASSEASIASYGRRFMEVALASTDQIQSEAEALALAERALQDLERPRLEAMASVPLFPAVELGDVVSIGAGQRALGGALIATVVAFTHSCGGGEGETELDLRDGEPCLRDIWTERDSRPGIARPVRPVRDVDESQTRVFVSTDTALGAPLQHTFPIGEVDYDRPAAWDQAENWYIAPEDGVYQVSMCASFTGATSGSAVLLWALRTMPGSSTAYFFINHREEFGSSDQIVHAAASSIRLRKGERVEFRIMLPNTGATVVSGEQVSWLAIRRER